MIPPLLPTPTRWLPGSRQSLAAGSQVISLSNIQTPAPNFSIIETVGFARQNIYSSVGQPFTPQQQSGINTFGSIAFSRV